MEFRPDEPTAQWSRVKEIFHEAVERAENERAAFVRDACDSDLVLESMVRSLLANDVQVESFLETPATLRVGLPIASEGPALAAGQQLGAYTVVGLIGAGGMGEVYRARDERLQRDVALKVLPDAVASDVRRREQFEQEARAAAALDHPNICAVYDIGEHDGHIWIAMQFIDGETLADQLTRSPLSPADALDVAEHIAEALSAAHARGIVHRDVKPQNVMITRTGMVKVLDFGLAQVARVAGADMAGSPDGAIAGARIGTVPYMSPEQVRGESLDLRTDVFSLGAVLYELVTGRRAFDGESDADITAAILSSTPPGITTLVSTVPQPLDGITRRCLEKTRELRYRDARELAVDLAKVKQNLRIGATRPVSMRALTAAGVLGTAAVAVFAAWVQSAGEPPTNALMPLQYTRLTNFPDSVHSPALSPDGKTLAFIRGPGSWEMAGAASDLYKKTLPDGNPIALTHDGTRKGSPTFTPDGSRIVFTGALMSRATGEYSLFSVPVEGGAPALFLRNASGLRWTGPDQLLFSETKRAPNMGIVAVEGTSGRRDVYVPASRTGMAHFSSRSPDGTHVLVVEMENAVLLPCRVVPFDGSSTGHVVGPPATECTSATWSPDGRWMYFSAVQNGESHLWRQRFPDGTPEQLTFGPNQESGVLVEPDGRSLITSVGAMQSTVWYHDDRGDRPLSVDAYAYRPLLSPNGRLVFYLVRRDARRSFIGELWTTDLATGENRRMFPAFLIRAYDVSDDGTSIVFDAFDDTDRSRLWIARTDASEAPRALSPEGGSDEQRPFFGAHGNIYFMREQSPGVQSLYRMKPDGSERRELLKDIDFLVNISPDEREAVLWHSGQGMSLVMLDTGVRRPLCTCGLGPIFPDSPSAMWSADGETVFLAMGRRTASMPWRDGRALPAGPVVTPADVANVPGVHYIPERSIAPGPTVGQYAFVRQGKQSNLFRIRLPM